MCRWFVVVVDGSVCIVVCSWCCIDVVGCIVGGCSGCSM